MCSGVFCIIFQKIKTNLTRLRGIRLKGLGKSQLTIKEFAATSLLAAIILLMTFTPFGFINLAVINATIVHVPVIIGSILMGPRAGACLGGIFGLASVIRNTISPTILSFAFSPLVPVPGAERGSLVAILICFLQRVLVGIVPHYTRRVLETIPLLKKSNAIGLFLSGVAGSVTNTILVMHLIFFLFKDAFAQARNVPVDAVYALVVSIITANGIPEAILAGVLSSAVCKSVETYRASLST